VQNFAHRETLGKTRDHLYQLGLTMAQLV